MSAMPNISNSGSGHKAAEERPTITLADKSDKLNIRCSKALKKEIQRAAVDRETTIENLCIGLLADGLGLAVDKTAEAA